MKKIISILSMVFVLFSLVGSGLAQDELTVQLPRKRAKINFQGHCEDKILVSVLNEEGNAVLGLTKDDFLLKKGLKTAKIISVEDVTEQRDIGLNIVLVVDNSYSMDQRHAVEPLLAAINEFLSLVRPIDNIQVVTFVDPKNGYGERKTSQPRVSTQSFQSSDPSALNQFLRQSYFPGMTDGTYLYDAMQQGLDVIRKIPAKAQKFMVVFSDGEDINSVVKDHDVEFASQGLPNFTVFAVDYMDRAGLDPFLQTFAHAHDGMIRKASSATDFLPIFKNFSTTIFHRYLVTYRFLDPPKGTLGNEPSLITREEITMVDSSPLLNYIYFDTGRSEIPNRYVTFSHPEETGGFSEERLTGTMEKYHSVLNVIGKRMLTYPEAQLTIVGCNSNTGVEKGNIALARSRADAVLAYFKYIWGIDPKRMEIKAQNLPAVPSTSRVPEGIIENQRVEILSNHPDILDTIKSTYVQELCDAKEIRVLPAIQAEAGIAKWQLKVMAAGNVLATRQGDGDLPLVFAFDVEALGIRNLAGPGQITAEIEVNDKEGNVFKASTSEPTKINFIRREERIAQKLDYKVIEKYGLILFDFDRAEIKARNKIIVNRVTARVADLPSALINITGYTDIIGKEDYNIKLSGRRAMAVYDTTLETGIALAKQISFEGVGPKNPPYDNGIPEGRALNRTVIITIQYTEKGQEEAPQS